MHKHFYSDDEGVIRKWGEMIGHDRVLPVDNAKACVDVMLGIIAYVSGARTLNAYVEDMKERGQDEQRIADVKKALSTYIKSDVQKTKIV